MRYSVSVYREAYIKALWNAEAKGRAAAEDFSINERDCPYSRYEHKKSWLNGFRSVRANMAKPPRQEHLALKGLGREA